MEYPYEPERSRLMGHRCRSACGSTPAYGSKEGASRQLFAALLKPCPSDSWLLEGWAGAYPTHRDETAINGAPRIWREEMSGPPAHAILAARYETAGAGSGGKQDVCSVDK
jgi:hypothetical protein